MKKIFTTVLLIISLLPCKTTLAWKIHYDHIGPYYDYVPFLECKSKSPDKIGIPFHVDVSWAMGGLTWVDPGIKICDSIDIVLSPKLELLQGNLHCKGPYYTDSMYHQDLLVRINEPGIYEIRANFDEWSFNHPRTWKGLEKKIYFYAREDTIVVFDKREDLDDGIKYSLFDLPAINKRRNEEAKRYERIRQFKITAAKMRLISPPVTTRNNLDILSQIDCFGGGPYLSIPRWLNQKLIIKYNDKQKKLIDWYHLLYSPYLDDVGLFVELDFDTTISVGKKKDLTEMMKRQLIELNNLDQEILLTEQIGTWEYFIQYCSFFGKKSLQEQLLTERKSLLARQTAERRAVVGEVK